MHIFYDGGTMSGGADIMLAKATDEQKDSLKKYMKKIKDIKLRVPEEYLEPIKEHAEHAE